VVKGVVMDVSDWLDEHPGGPQAIMNFMGRDATEEFEMLHDDEGKFSWILFMFYKNEY
jgi:cytochrome b involved in lipid metabolism